MPGSGLATWRTDDRSRRARFDPPKVAASASRWCDWRQPLAWLIQHNLGGPGVRHSATQPSGGASQSQSISGPRGRRVRSARAFRIVSVATADHVANLRCSITAPSAALSGAAPSAAKRSLAQAAASSFARVAPVWLLDRPRLLTSSFPNVDKNVVDVLTPRDVLGLNQLRDLSRRSGPAPESPQRGVHASSSKVGWQEVSLADQSRSISKPAAASLSPDVPAHAESARSGYPVPARRGVAEGNDQRTASPRLVETARSNATIWLLISVASRHEARCEPNTSKA
jgi:hypothetical protein